MWIFENISNICEILCSMPYLNYKYAPFARRYIIQSFLHNCMRVQSKPFGAGQASQAAT